MINETEINASLINQWLVERLNSEEIEAKLMALGVDSDNRAVYIKAYNKIKYAKRQSLGFILAGIGALLGFVSCVLTMINPIPALNDFFLFGLTTIAVIIVFAGLYLVFE